MTVCVYIYIYAEEEKTGGGGGGGGGRWGFSPPKYIKGGGTESPYYFILKILHWY